MYFEFGKRELSKTPSFEQLSQTTISAKSQRKKEIFSYVPLGKFLKSEEVQPSTSKNAQNNIVDTSGATCSKAYNFKPLTKLKTIFAKKTVDRIDSTEDKIGKSGKSNEVNMKDFYLK